MSALSDVKDMKEALAEEQANATQVPAPVAPTDEVDTTASWMNWNPKAVDDYNEHIEKLEWEATAAVYEWDGDMGEVAPTNDELELQLFGAPNASNSKIIDFDAIDRINVIQEGKKRVDPIVNFKDLGLHPVMMRNVELMKYHRPTPIQRFTMPAIKLGHDVLAVAQTGSGKTASYLVPIINALMGKAKKLAAPRPTAAECQAGARVCAEPLVVIIVPARELAVQIFNEARKFCYRTMLRPGVVYGGFPIPLQIDNLRKGCDIVVASPGRLVDLMERNGVLSLRRVKYMVLDEADEMLSGDWEESMSKIFGGGEQDIGSIQYMLFSATFPPAVRRLAQTYLANDHVRIRVGRVGSTHANIKQDILWVDPEVKRQALFDLLKSYPPGRTIIFVNNKRTVDEIDDFLYNQGFPCTSIHAERGQREREDAMRAFRSGAAPILVATGIMARGIDVRNIMHVVNYDLPSMEHGGIAEYTHRIGRTGRMGGAGMSTSFYNERDESMAAVLTMTLMETGQDIPDFLECYKPLDSNLKFENEGDDDEAADKDGWGASTTGEAAADDGWGASTTGGDDAWGAKATEDTSDNANGQGGNSAETTSGDTTGRNNDNDW